MGLTIPKILATNAPLSLKHMNYQHFVCALVISLFTCEIAVCQVAKPSVAPPKPAPAAPESRVPGMEGVEQKVKDLQNNVNLARAKLEKANATPEERKKEFDDVIAAVNGALVEVSPKGTVYEQLNTAIKTAEERAKYFKDKASDPKLKGDMQLKYQELSKKFEASNKGLYQAMMSLNNQRSSLQSKLEEVSQSKGLYVDLVQADQMKEANEAVVAVVASMKDVDSALDSMMKNVSVTPDAPDTKPQ